MLIAQKKNNEVWLVPENPDPRRIDEQYWKNHNPGYPAAFDIEPGTRLEEDRVELVWQTWVDYDETPKWCDLHPMEKPHSYEKQRLKVRRAYRLKPETVKKEDVSFGESEKLEEDKYRVYGYQIEVKYFGEAGWLASTNLFKGCVAQGDTEEEVLSEIAKLIETNRCINN